MEIHQASRTSIKPLIVAYSESGCGKTYSSLLLARGFVGPGGKIALIDSESGRGELYADVIEGGYSVLRLEPPFSPQRYIEAQREVLKWGAQIIIVDSGSHEWEGSGGVLDQAGANEERTGKPGLHCWKAPKLEHAKWVLELLRAPVPVIVCLRAKFKSRQTKENGKTVIVKDDHTSPIQSEEFIFEATAHFEILPDHSVNLTKCSHPALRSCFPSAGPITVEHGRKLAEWCHNPTAKPKDDLAILKKQLWEMTKEQHGGKTAALEKWLIDRAILGDSETLAGLTVERLKGVLADTELLLSDVIP